MHNRNYGFIEQKCIFEHNREFQVIKTQLIDIIFATKIYLLTFLELPPYRLMLVRHKDVLFH